MAIKISGTTVVNDSRQLQNIASLDSTTAATIASAGSSFSDTLGAVGSTAWMKGTSTSYKFYQGSTYSGSTLRYAGFFNSSGGTTYSVDSLQGGTSSGTWRAMGQSTQNSRYNQTLFVRIS